MAGKLAWNHATLSAAIFCTFLKRHIKKIPKIFRFHICKTVTMWRIMWTMRTMSIFAGLGTDSVTSLDTFWCSGTVFPPSRCTHLVRSNHRWAQKPLRWTLHKKMHKKFTTEMYEEMYQEKSEKREPNLAAAFAHRAASRNFAPNAFSAPEKRSAWDILESETTWNSQNVNMNNMKHNETKHTTKPRFFK